MTAPHISEVVLDTSQAGDPFPPIHEGRYEVDPWATKLTPATMTDGFRDAVRRAGVRLLRVGVGCWLPGQDPDPSTLVDREWFTGTTLADVDDPANFNWTHLDRNLDVCLALDCEVLLSVDSMPTSLARKAPQIELPDALKPFAPEGYTFMDGVRNAPAADPEVFAAASLVLLRHVEERGVRIRYVELWNEPDLPIFYSGTFEEWWAMYVPFAHAVHAAGYKVGGPSWAFALGPELWLEQIVKRAVAEQVPLDFYSFHRYSDRTEEIVERCQQVRMVLDQVGLKGTELLLDEWGYDLRQAPVFGTVRNAAFVATCMMQFPDAGVAAQTNVLLIDPFEGMGRLHGITRKDGNPNPLFYAIEAFERFQATPHRIRTAADSRVLAGVDAGGRRLSVIAANPDESPLAIALSLGRGKGTGVLRRLTQSGFDASGAPAEEAITLGSDSLDITLEPDSLVMIEASLDGTEAG